MKDEKIGKSMIAMVAGGITNVILDYIFVFPLGMGMKGTGIATGIASVVSLLIYFYYIVEILKLSE